MAYRSATVPTFFQGRSRTLRPDEMAFGVVGILKLAKHTKVKFIVQDFDNGHYTDHIANGVPAETATTTVFLYLLEGQWRCLVYDSKSTRSVCIAVEDDGAAARTPGSRTMAEQLREALARTTSEHNILPEPLTEDPKPIVLQTPNFGIKPRWSAGAILLVLFGAVVVEDVPYDDIEDFWTTKASLWDVAEWLKQGQTILWANF